MARNAEAIFRAFDKEDIPLKDEHTAELVRLFQPYMLHHSTRLRPEIFRVVHEVLCEEHDKSLVTYGQLIPTWELSLFIELCHATIKLPSNNFDIKKGVFHALSQVWDFQARLAGWHTNDGMHSIRPRALARRIAAAHLDRWGTTHPGVLVKLEDLIYAIEQRCVEAVERISDTLLDCIEFTADYWDEHGIVWEGFLNTVWGFFDDDRALNRFFTRQRHPFFGYFFLLIALIALTFLMG